MPRSGLKGLGRKEPTGDGDAVGDIGTQDGQGKDGTAHRNETISGRSSAEYPVATHLMAASSAKPKAPRGIQSAIISQTAFDTSARISTAYIVLVQHSDTHSSRASASLD